MRLIFLLNFILCFNVGFSQQSDTAAQNIIDICTADDNQIQNDISLRFWFQSLDSLRKKQKLKLNIIHIGDSHIQGDYMSRTIRFRLQQEFGEGGRGLVFPYSFLNMYGPVDYKCKTNVKWENSRIFPREKNYPVGLVGYTVASNNPNLQAMIELTGPPKKSWGSLENFTSFPDNRFNRVKIIYSNDSQAMPVVVSQMPLENTKVEAYRLPNFSLNDTSGFQIQTIDFENLSDKIEIKADSTTKFAKPFQLYGLIFENTQREGIVYHMAGVGACQLDNFMRSKYFFSQTTALSPNLIIISLGANESVNQRFDTVGYVKKFVGLIENLKKEIPGVSILLTTPPDILYKGKLPFMKKPIQRAIIKIATETNSAFWNLGELMGGDYSNHIWHLSKFAGPDRIHFTPKGYDFQGLLFMEALLKSYNKYSYFPVNDSVIKNDLEPYRKLLKENYVNEVSRINQFKERVVDSNSQQPSRLNIDHSNRKIHLVRKNETIFSISRKFKIDYRVILRLNGLRKSSVIKPGQKIKLN